MNRQAIAQILFIILCFVSVFSLPFPFLRFALGLQDEKEIEEYKKFGFNAIWIDVFYKDSQIQKKLQLAKEAEKGNLIPIICLHLEAKDFGTPTPLNEDYRQKTTSWVKEMAEEFKDLSRLVWALGYDPAQAIEYNESDFASYLVSWYGSFKAISEAWGKEVNFPSDITFSLVEKLSADKEGEVPRYGISRPSLDLAIYKWISLRDLLNLWLGELKGATGTRMEQWVITGILKDYKSIMVVPFGYDGITVAFYPSELEKDFLIHNPHGVAIARRGGLFSPIAIFQLIKEGEYKTSPFILKQYLNNALLQGAMGLGFDNWETLKSLPELKEILNEDIYKTPLEPENKIAVLYEPFLEGYNLNGRGLFGFLKTQLVNQPSDLFFTLRLGCKYGGIDFLGVDDLDKVDINRYKVILAPSAFYLPPIYKEILSSFILFGGMLVADIGLDCYETGSLSIPSDFVKHNCGVEGFWTITKGRGNFRVNIEHPLFPLLKKNQESDGNADGFAVDGCIGFAYVGAKTDILATLGAMAGAGGRMAVAGILVRKNGLGYCIYATFPLWRNWLPYNKLFVQFHESILSWESEMWLNDVLFPSFGRFNLLKNGFAILNLTPYKTALSLRIPIQLFYEGCVTAPREDGAFDLLVPLEESEIRVFNKVIPLIVQPDYLLVHIEKYSADKVIMRILGRGGRIVAGDDKLLAVPMFTTPGVILLSTGEYKITKGSSHKITITNTQTGEKKSFIIKANSEALRIEWDFHSEIVEIEKG